MQWLPHTWFAGPHSRLERSGKKLSNRPSRLGIGLLVKGDRWAIFDARIRVGERLLGPGIDDNAVLCLGKIALSCRLRLLELQWLLECLSIEEVPCTGIFGQPHIPALR